MSNCVYSVFFFFFFVLYHLKKPSKASYEIWGANFEAACNVLFLELRKILLSFRSKQSLKILLDLFVFQEILDSLAELYSLLQEEDMWAGLWQKRCKFPETATAIAYEQHGFFEQVSNRNQFVAITVKTSSSY